MSPSQELYTSRETQHVGTRAYAAGSWDPVYHAKANILNDDLQKIGMGKYQWRLFVVAGFGWLTDELWLVSQPLIYTSVVREFNVQGAWMILAQSLGLLIGAIFWSIGCDVWGRRWSFNFTVLITSVFTLIAATSSNYTVLCAYVFVGSLGVGGNLPVDAIIFLEFVPPSHQFLLTVLSVWWSFGDLVGSLVAWPLISNFSCPPAPAPCPASSNNGWRYFFLAIGSIMTILWVIRFFSSNQEGPKYLMGHGRDDDAVAVMHSVAKINGENCSLTVSLLKEAEAINGGSIQNEGTSTGAMRKLMNYQTSNIKIMFSTRELAYSTSILIILWALVGLASPLSYDFQTYYMQTRGMTSSLSITYRNQVISSFLRIQAGLFAGYLVEVPAFGRRRTLSICTALTGVFIFLSTTARTPEAYDGWNCAISYASTVMFAVLFAISMELFPSKARGTGTAIVATAFHIFSAVAAIIALYGGINTSVPLWVSGAIFIPAGFIALLLPIEPRGRGSIEI